MVFIYYSLEGTNIISINLLIKLNRALLVKVIVRQSKDLKFKSSYYIKIYKIHIIGFK